MLWNKYFEWLTRFCKLSRVFCLKYEKLLNLLHHIDFFWIIRMDENRAEDGMYLREMFEDETGYLLSDENLNRDCTVLEVLISLSFRIDSEYIGNPRNPSPDKIFTTLLDNLGLSKYSNNHMDEDAVEEIVTRWMNRNFTAHGIGSIFPVRDNHGIDQREIEIWSQMQAYINERY